jgi:hypothetical protein
VLMRQPPEIVITAVDQSSELEAWMKEFQVKEK